MKKDFNYLLEEKRIELTEMVALILTSIPAEMIILCGSYSTNDSVEKKRNEKNRWQNLFDIVVMIAHKSEVVPAKLEKEIEDRINQNHFIKTPFYLRVHDIDFMNQRWLTLHFKKTQVFLLMSELDFMV